MSDTPCSMGCPCPGPKPGPIYDTFEKAIDALKLIFLKSGFMMPVYYKDGSEVKCLIAVGNADPADEKIIITDSGRTQSLLQKFAQVDASIAAIEAPEAISDASINELFGTYKYTVTILNNCAAGKITKGDTSALYKEGDVVSFTATAYDGYRWSGWYNDGALVSTETGLDCSIYSSKIVRPVDSASSVTESGLCGLFTQSCSLDTSLIETITIETEADIITVTGADSSLFEDTTFEKGADLTFDASVATGHDFESYVITTSNPELVQNWSTLGTEVDANTRKVTDSSFGMLKVNTDIAVKATIKEVKYVVAAQVENATSLPSIIVQTYIDGDYRGEVLRGGQVTVGCNIMSEQIKLDGWYVENVKVSSEREFSVTPTADTVYVAKFIDL